VTPAALLKRALYWAGVVGPARRADVAWILTYHSVSDDGTAATYAGPGIVVPPVVFERHVRFLARTCRIVSLDALAAWLAGDLPLAGPAVAITFDDGYRDNYAHAYPILRRYGATATFYVVTEAIGDAEPLWTAELRGLLLRARARGVPVPRIGDHPVDVGDPAALRRTIRGMGRILRAVDRATRRGLLAELRARLGPPDGPPAVMMTWDELREMHRGGMTIGSHTMSHPALTEIPPAEAAREIAGSRARLEAELDAPVTHFAYPNPGACVHVDEAVKALVREAGYSTARTSSKGPVTPGADLLALPTLGVSNRHDHPAHLAWMLSARAGPVRRPASAGAPGVTRAPSTAPAPGAERAEETR